MSLPMPLTITLDQLRGLAADPDAPYLVAEAIEAMGGDDAPGETEMDMEAMLDGGEAATLAVAWMLYRTHPDTLRSWSLDMGEAVLADAVHTLGAIEPRIGGGDAPRKVIAAATRILAALRAGLPPTPDRLTQRWDWYQAWDGHGPWYLTTYAMRSTPSPYRALARAVIDVLSTHDIAADPRQPRSPTWRTRDLLEAVREAGDSSRRETYRADVLSFRTRAVLKSALDDMARDVGEQRVVMADRRLREYLAGTATRATVTPATRRGRGRVALVQAQAGT